MKVTAQVFSPETPDDKIDAVDAVIAAVNVVAATNKALTLARGPRLSVVDCFNAMAGSIYGRQLSGRDGSGAS